MQPTNTVVPLTLNWCGGCLDIFKKSTDMHVKKVGRTKPLVFFFVCVYWTKS